MVYLSAIRIAEPWTFVSLLSGAVLLVVVVAGIVWYIQRS